MNILLVMAISFLLASCAVVSGSPSYQGKIKYNFDGSRFLNIKQHKSHSILDVISWRLQREDPSWPDWINNLQYPPSQDKNCSNDNVHITLINHATFLIQLNCINILTDPLWKERTSPVDWVGPKRIHAPGIPIDKLPNIDLVLISHNHYDHLDLDAVKSLKQKFNPQFISGLGNDLLLKKHDISKTTSLDWWEHSRYKNLEIYFVPAQHFSGRGLLDRDQTLWGGFVIKSRSKVIYFAGDTGWGPHFQLIKDRYGNIDLSILPIGQYEPRYFMKHAHINPEEAVRAMMILRSHYSIGFGADSIAGLADEKHGQAIMDLRKALRKHHLPLDRFITIAPGQNCSYETEIVCAEDI